MTLTFDLMSPRSRGVICRSWPISLSTFMILGLSFLQLWSGNDFTVSGPCDLWPYEPKINRGLLLVMTNLPINFHDPRPKGSPLIIRKWFFCLGPRDLDLMSPKSIGVICQSWPTSLSTFRILGLSILQLSSGIDFTVSGPCDLDLWPYEPKINRGLLPLMNNLPINFHDPRP